MNSSALIKDFKESIKGGIMAKKILICLAWVSMVLFLFSCTKLPDTQAPAPIIYGKFGMEILKLADSIPLKWGNLIAVSNVNPEWTRLWFQDKDGNIYLILYDMKSNKFLEKYRFMKRG